MCVGYNSPQINSEITLTSHKASILSTFARTKQLLHLLHDPIQSFTFDKNHRINVCSDSRNIQIYENQLFLSLSHAVIAAVLEKVDSRN